MSATVAARKRTHPKLTAKTGIILHLGCRDDKQPGAVGLDPRPGQNVDIVHDWDELPWPLESESVLTLLATNVVERVDPARGHFLDWMNEAWRILKPGRRMVIITPFAGSDLCYADPGACNPCNHQTFWYFDPGVNITRTDGPDKTPYATYEPAPWEIESVVYPHARPLQVVLKKRVDLADYHHDGKVHYR